MRTSAPSTFTSSRMRADAGVGPVRCSRPDPPSGSVISCRPVRLWRMSACGASRAMVTRSRRGIDAHCHEAANASWAMGGRISHAARRNRARPAGVFRITGFASKNRAMLKVCHVPGNESPECLHARRPACLPEPSGSAPERCRRSAVCLTPLPRGACRAVVDSCFAVCPSRPAPSSRLGAACVHGLRHPVRVCRCVGASGRAPAGCRVRRRGVSS